MRKHAFLILFVTVILLPTVAHAAVMGQSQKTMQLDANFWIEPGQIRTWYSLTADVIYIQVRVTSGDGLEFFICDGSNYDDWRDELPATLYEHQSSMTSVSLVYDTPRLDDWRVVFYNDDDVSQHLEGWVGLDPPPLLSIDSAIMIGGAISVVIAIAGFGWYRRSQTKRGRPSTAPPEMIQ